MPNGGPSRAPRKTLLKKFAYTNTIQLNNSTSYYAYYSKYVRPNLLNAVGAAPQFAAYELWRLKRLRVSIQMANNDTSQAPTAADPINTSTTSTVWTAADYGANETVSGESIMQYQNAKKNTININKFTKIVDTDCRLNGTLGISGVSATSSCIIPRSTWLNTAGFGNSSLFTNAYSGYQLFIQCFGLENLSVQLAPAFTLVTELDVEFMQPAYQNNSSSFAVESFHIKMQCQPDASDPTALRSYVFDRITVEDDAGGERVMTIRLKREDGQPGSLTFTAAEMRSAIETGTSGQYFSGRPIIYDGPFPPSNIPDETFMIENLN